MAPRHLPAFTLARFNSIPASTYQYLWWNGPDSITGGYGCFLSSSANIRAGWGGYSAATTDTSVETAGTLYRICSRFTSTDGLGPNVLFINNSQVSSKDEGHILPLESFRRSVQRGDFGPTPGSGLYGDIAEILIYDRALTDTERTSVDQYLQSRWLPTAPTAVDRLKDVKALGDGVLVSITSAKVAVVASDVYSDGSVYVIESDRTAGLKVTGAGTVNLFDNLTLTGTTDTDAATGERVLRVTSVSKAAGTDPGTLGMANKSFSASGQYTRVWGKVTAKTATYMTVDDGSGSPVKVEIDGLATPLTVNPNIGQYISATGPAGMMAGSLPCVRPRADSDIMVY